jgi:2-polyprenyl-6-methoxyphenol hydroxylase-like FAD-dependent oxidoreductase
MAAPDFDVCIIGYGPIGASLANLLGQSDMKTVVLERESSVYHLPRAVALDGEGMRLVQTMGLAAAEHQSQQPPRQRGRQIAPATDSQRRRAGRLA